MLPPQKRRLILVAGAWFTIYEHTSSTIFQKNEISEPALFSPCDTTNKIHGFPEICVSTFSENIIQKFSSLSNTEKIAELYTANGIIPVYKIRYHDTDIAFYLSRIGAPACVAGFEEIIAMGAKKFVLFGSCGVLDDDKVKDQRSPYHSCFCCPRRRNKLSLYSAFVRN